MVGILSYMSYDRVDRMIKAGVRINAFGPVDLLPIILYIFEVFTGMFIWYVVLRALLGIDVYFLKKKFDASVRRCSELTINTVQAFNRAEKLGYNIFGNQVAKSIQEAFCRNDSLTEANGIDYISEQTIGLFPIKLKLFHHGSNDPLIGNVKVITDYKFSGAEGTDNGNLQMNLESILRLKQEPGNRTEDSLRIILVEYHKNGALERKNVEVAIDMDLEGPHTVFL
jgi:hypothetical protein